MMPRNKLGVLARVSVQGEAAGRLCPALSPDGARELQRAFLADWLERVQFAKASITVFAGGEPPEELAALMPRPWPIVRQADGAPGQRMAGAFSNLLTAPDCRAVLVGSDSPDLPLPFIKRAFQRLKHRDVVIGPALSGGYYLIGLRAPTPALFEGIDRGSNRVLAETLEIIAREKLSVSLLPPWYTVDDAQSLEVLRALCAARRLVGGVRLPRTEALLTH